MNHYVSYTSIPICENEIFSHLGRIFPNIWYYNLQFYQLPPVSLTFFFFALSLLITFKNLYKNIMAGTYPTKFFIQKDLQINVSREISTKKVLLPRKELQNKCIYNARLGSSILPLSHRQLSLTLGQCDRGLLWSIYI